MAKGITVGGRQLNYTANLSIEEALKRATKLKSGFDDMVAAARKVGNVPVNTNQLTGYQQAQIGLKKALADSQLETEKLRQETQRYRSELEQGKIAQQNVKNQLEALRAVEQMLNNDLKSGRIVLQQHTIEIERNKAAQAQLTATLAQGRVEQQNIRTEIARMTLARKQEVEAQRQARKAAQEVSGSYNEAQKKLRDLGNEIKSAEGAFKKLTPELKAKVKEYNELNEALKKFDAQMGNHQRNVGNYKGALRSTAEDLLGFASAYLSVGNALTFVFNETLAFQRIKTPLTFILGSEGEASNKLIELKKFSEDIGVQFFTIAESYKKFTAAARASNFDLGESEKIFKSVTKAGAVLGLSSEQLEGTLLALQQMISKGNVQSEELRGQLSERLPGAFALAAKAMNVTEGELGNMLKTGQVVAKDLLPKLAVELDKAYGDKAANGISGLNAELARLKTELESNAGDSSALSKRIFEPIIVGAREAVKEIGQMFRGSFGENLRYFFTFSSRDLANQRLVYDLRDSRRNNENAQTAAEQYKTEGKSLADLRTKYSQITETLRNSYDARAKFIKGVKEGTLKETKDATIGNYTAIANGLNAQRKRIADAILDAKHAQLKANKETLDSELTSITAIQKRIAELKKMAGSAIAGSEVYNRIQALQDRLKKPGLPKYEAEETGQRTLQKQIDDAIASSQRKQVDANAKEVLEVKKKYADLRKAADDHNKEVDKYNNALANKNKRKKIKVDASGLNKAESEETDFVVDKGKAEELKTDLEKKKRYYEDFENFRTKVGKEKAEQRYKDLIDVNKTYRQYLDSIDAKLNGVDDKTKGGDGDGERVAQQIAVVKKEREAILVEEEKKYQDLLSQLVSYEEEKAAKIQSYEAKRSQLVKDNRTEEIKVLDKIQFESMAAFEGENVEKLTAFKELFKGIEDLSAEAARRVIGNGKALIDGLLKKGIKLSPELQKEIEDALKNATKSLKLRVPEELILIGNEIQNLAGFAGEVNEAFGQWVGTLGGTISGIGQLRKTMLDFKDLKKGDTLGALGLGAQAIAIGGGIFSGITKAISGIIQSSYQKVYERRVADNELQIKQSEAVSRALDRQLSLINKVYGTEKLTAYNQALKDIDSTTESVSKKLNGMFLNTGNSELDRLIGLYNSGTLETKGFDRASFNQLLDKGVFRNIDTSDIEALRKLIGSGALDATAERYAQQLVDLKDKSVEAANAVKETLTGTTFENFADSLVDLFAKGTASAEDFGKNFEDIMKKSILNSFKTKTIATQLQAFYDQFSELSSTGRQLTEDEVKILKAKYDTIIKEGQNEFDNLQKVSGVSFLDNSSSTSSVGKISASLTEATGSELLGLYRSQYDISKKIEINTRQLGSSIGDLYLIAKSNFELQVKIEANTYRTAENTEPLKAIKAGIDTLVKNSNASGSTGYDRGI
ncbi:tape measure protein [Pedobacter zeae]|uniref:Tape measure domain-containing protein n=1 Tax=Pedobacter zeae TaxID=1737356 RepID=A0A7W6KD39_9SPHI|nr:tape measure protein [Pedobacter zeae]MBB4108332.1 tape measure domain-containing protein [Pedobacter zeae]GGG93490.1 hypothetical protein GCM10007422_03410 [Pedobacter zeae]